MSLDCSIPVSLIENNDFAAIITFYDNDFKTLLDLSCGEESPADNLLILKQKSRSISLFRDFFKENLHADVDCDILSAINYRGFPQISLKFLTTFFSLMIMIMFIKNITLTLFLLKNIMIFLNNFMKN